MNDGKRFEADFRLSVGRYAIRLYDTTTGYSGVKNPCDFIYHTSPYLNLLELKSVKGKRLDYSIISENQKEQLTFFLSAKYVNPVILVEFRDFKSRNVNSRMWNGFRSLTEFHSFFDIQ